MNHSKNSPQYHLDITTGKQIISHTLGLKDEIAWFEHWRGCMQCQEILRDEMCKKRFEFSHKHNGELYFFSIKTTPAFHFITDDTSIIKASFNEDLFQDSSFENNKTSDNLTDSFWQNRLCQQLEDYFEQGNPFQAPDIKPTIYKTPFMKDVLSWTALIPFGKTCSYGDIARWMQNPHSSRAVGGALHRNPVPVLIPCHRVLGSQKQLTGYNGGLDLKKILLKLEKSAVLTNEIHF